jgi:hypothetical protein
MKGRQNASINDKFSKSFTQNVIGRASGAGIYSGATEGSHFLLSYEATGSLISLIGFVINN